jgi:hypothetical protein
MWASRQFDYQEQVVRFLNFNKETITDVSICNNGGNITNNAFVVFFKIHEGCIVYEVNN